MGKRRSSFFLFWLENFSFSFLLMFSGLMEQEYSEERKGKSTAKHRKLTKYDLSSANGPGLHGCSLQTTNTAQHNHKYYIISRKHNNS